MANSLLIFLLLLAGSGIVHAGYAELAPPPGFAQTSAGSTFNFQKAASNAAIYSANGVNTVRTTAALNVGGRAVTVPAAMRFAANAGTFAAGKSFHPALLLGALALPYVVEWASGKFELRPDETEPGGQSWHKVVLGTGYRVVAAPAGYPQGITTSLFSTPLEAFTAWTVAASAADAGFFYQVRSQTGLTAQIGKYQRWNNGLYGIIGMSVHSFNAPNSYQKATQTEFEQTLAPLPFNPLLPTVTPWEWPVEQPKVNPSPYPTGNPAPLSIPMGSPVLQPDGSYKQPSLRVQPSPTTWSPWRVELIPQDWPSTDGVPLPEPVPDPFNPNGKPGDPLVNPPPSGNPNPNPDPVNNPNPSGNGTPSERQPSLCEQHPNILACQNVNLGSTDVTPVADDSRNLAINKDQGWGPENGTCPAPKTATVMGLNLQMPFTALCDFAEAFRPILIGLAWLSAAMTFFGIGRKE